MRFNPPPNWPEPPKGWAPPPGWQPDPAWGPAPEGWQLWVKGRRGGMPLWWGLVLVTLAVALGWGMLSPGSGGSGARERACVEAVRARLVAPDGADVRSLAVAEGDGVWRYRGTVDSENGLGARLRSTWVCVVSDGAVVQSVSID